MNINVSNEFIVVGSFFFLVSWFLTTLFMRSGAFFRVVIFALSTALFMTLEHLESIELTVISFVAAITAYYGGLVQLFYIFKDALTDAYYWLKGIFFSISSFFHFIVSAVKRVIFIIISIFKPSEKLRNHKKYSQNPKQQRQGNNNKNHQNYEEQREKAKAQFRQAREEAERKEKLAQEKYQSERSDDKRSFEEILGLHGGFTHNELKMAYKRSASKFHPDKYSHMSKNFRDEAEQEFKKIQKAYTSLLKKSS